MNPDLFCVATKFRPDEEADWCICGWVFDEHFSKNKTPSKKAEPSSRRDSIPRVADDRNLHPGSFSVT
jgi:hypothetical protein